MYIVVDSGATLLSAETKAECADGEVKLGEEKDEREGLVELCYGGVWGPVVDSNALYPSWDFQSAAVVCRQLGYEPLGNSNH